MLIDEPARDRYTNFIKDDHVEFAFLEGVRSQAQSLLGLDAVLLIFRVIIGGDKTAPGPDLPAEIIDRTAARYRERVERLFGPAPAAEFLAALEGRSGRPLGLRSDDLSEAGSALALALERAFPVVTAQGRAAGLVTLVGDGGVDDAELEEQR